MNLAYIHYLAGDAPALTHARQFSNAARAQGHRIDVIAQAAGKTELPGSQPSPPSRLRRFAGKYTREARLTFANATRLRQQIQTLRELAPDAVLARQELLTCSHALAAKALNLPLILEVNAPVAESREYFGEYWHIPAVAEWMERRTLQQADGIFTVSTPLQRHLIECARNEGPQPVVVANGVDTQLFSPDGPRDPIADGLRDRVVIGFVGSYQHFHEIDLLVELVDAISKKHPNAAFLFVGDGPDAGEIRKQASALGDRAVFVGHAAHDRVPALVRAMDIAVLPGTAYYCSPLKIMEWMASGCAVVAPHTEPLEDTLEHGVEGMLFEPSKIDAFVAAVDQLIAHPEMRESLGQAAAARAQATMSWDENARSVMALCERARERHQSKNGSSRSSGSSESSGAAR